MSVSVSALVIGAGWNLGKGGQCGLYVRYAMGEGRGRMALCE